MNRKFKLGKLSYFRVFPHLIRQKTLTTTESVILDEIFQVWSQSLKQGKLKYGGYVLITHTKIRKDSNISERTQSRIISKLVSMNLVFVKLKGLPAKNWYSINAPAYIELIQGEKN